MAEQLITAAWRIDLGTVGGGGVRLLDFADYTQGEPEIVRNCVPEGPVTAFRAANQQNRPQYNVSYSLTVSRMVVCAGPWQARAFLLSFAASIPTAPLNATISYTNGAGDIVAAQVLSGALVKPGMKIVTKNDRCYIGFTIDGGALSAP